MFECQFGIVPNCDGEYTEFDEGAAAFLQRDGRRQNRRLRRHEQQTSQTLPAPVQQRTGAQDHQRPLPCWGSRQCHFHAPDCGTRPAFEEDARGLLPAAPGSTAVCSLPAHTNYVQKYHRHHG
eukprot:Gregarina_sp_Pseudo_9__2066@NODE_2433_length_997_cov_3_075157_g2239_i0_p2_GENE_NODE_2433_length_997_cov_3_075157_g2239_i0NODE_2433_length_997_cov_3_075157_g2239_i0_p2_ORF_typecomplete_len123_score8_96Herpes_US9/PF06072_11/0_011_NODE_2433_length_997_cov_3_075157_g2239_i061429